MANAKAKRRDLITTLVFLGLTILFIILAAVVESPKWIFIVLAVINGLLTLVMLLGIAHLKSTKKTPKYPSWSSSSSSTSSSSSSSYSERKESPLQAQIKSELIYLTPEEIKYWNLYHDAQVRGYRYFQRSKTPLDWKERVWGNLTTYQKLHYPEVVKHDIKMGKQLDFEQNHKGLMQAKKVFSYIVNRDFLDPLYEKINNLYSGGGSITQKDSADTAARDIKRMLNYCGTYSDGENGTCQYFVDHVFGNKYNQIQIDVRVSKSSIGSGGSLSMLQANLKTEIYNAVFVESGGYDLDITVF